MLAITGIGLLLGVTTEYEGPLIVVLTEEHAIRFVDAIGLAFIVVATITYFRILRRLLRNPVKLTNNHSEGHSTILTESQEEMLSYKNISS